VQAIFAPPPESCAHGTCAMPAIP